MSTSSAVARASGAHARPFTLPSLLALLTSRLLLFALLQAGVAAWFAATGHAAPWAESVRWWPLTVIVANLLGVVLLDRLLRREGLEYRQLIPFERATLLRDLLITLGLLMVGGVLAMAPNLGLAVLLWGDPQAPLALFVQPLPLPAALIAALGFPLTIAFAELPTYYGYLRPRLERLGLSPWLAIGLTGLFHSLQHATLPLVFDPAFILWRSVMFLPFALFVAVALRRLPRLLPWLMVAHGLIDLSVGLMILQTSLN